MANVVAAMGSTLSERQQALLGGRFNGVVIFCDGDAAGRKAVVQMTTGLVRRMWVRIVDCPEGLQPDQLSAQELQRILTGVVHPCPR
jgi:DNA primase